MQHVEASAASDGTACELNQPAFVGVCGSGAEAVVEGVEHERLKGVTLKGELPQWPLLQLVQVVELLDGDVLETLLFANSLSEVLKD